MAEAVGMVPSPMSPAKVAHVIIRQSHALEPLMT